jgi:hypothetical protein
VGSIPVPVIILFIRIVTSSSSSSSIIRTDRREEEEEKEGESVALTQNQRRCPIPSNTFRLHYHCRFRYYCYFYFYCFHHCYCFYFDADAGGNRCFIASRQEDEEQEE